MSVVSNFISFVANLGSKVAGVFQKPAVQAFVVKAAQVAVKWEPLVKDIASANFEAAAIVAVFDKYGLPVAKELASGQVTASDEVKKYIAEGVSLFLQKNENVSTTVANIARDLAYLNVKA